MSVKMIVILFVSSIFLGLKGNYVADIIYFFILLNIVARVDYKPKTIDDRLVRWEAYKKSVGWHS